MKNCLVCKIVSGDIPSNKIWENKNFFVFLDIKPINIGHALIVPKAHYEYIFNLPQELYLELMLVAKEIAPAIKKATKAKKIGIVVEGFGLEHVHLHLIPINHGNEIDPANATPAIEKELNIMAKKIKRLF